MKRLIICADGTWDTPDKINPDDNSSSASDPQAKTLYNVPIREPTNVVKMARAIFPTASNKTVQVVYYDTGVGTGLGMYDKIIGGGFGVGLSNNILQCYRFLVDNYDEGDEIFLFGFSRGAFTVRSLAGLIYRCGLLTKDDAYYIPEAYEQYLLSNYDSSLPGFLLGAGFRNRSSPTRNVKIKFIGVWDTVGALGLPFHGLIPQYFNKRYAFHDVQLGSNVQFAYQALAIDEWREPFKATLWDPIAPLPRDQTLEQCWFAGCHSNVGGSLNADHFPDENDKRPYRLENYAFQWMVEKATAPAIGLEVDKKYISYFLARPDCTMRNTLVGIYKLWGKYLRPIGKTKYGNETIHQSVFDRMELKALPKYEPSNLMEFLRRSGNQ